MAKKLNEDGNPYRDSVQHAEADRLAVRRLGPRPAT